MDKICAGRGTAIFDYNNDGLLDIVVTAAHAGCTLYRNNGDGTFTDVTVNSGLDQCINGFVIIAGDYDNDGFQDLFVTRLGFYYGDCSLYHNNGDGTFTNVTEEWGLDSVFTTIGLCWGDYNNDGYRDLFLSSGLGRPQLFRNNGNGTFTDVSIAVGLTGFVVGTTCCFADYNNDGWLDIVQYSWSDHEDAIYTMKTGHGPEDGSPLIVYHNNGDGTFTAKTRAVGLDGCWGTMSGNYGDVNNDGYIDLLLVT